MPSAAVEKQLAAFNHHCKDRSFHSTAVEKAARRVSKR